MPRIDLRHEVPPLGFNGQDVPLIDVDFAALDLEKSRLDNLLDSDAPVDVFAHPKSPDLVIRRHSFELEDASTYEGLIAYLRYAEAEHVALTEAGIPVLASRHLEARLPSADLEGELFSLSLRLLTGYEHLDPRREDHIGSSIFVLRGLTRYAKDVLSRNPTTHPRFLRDVFKPHQFSTTGRKLKELLPFLHDVDPIQEDTHEDSGRPSLTFRAAVGELKDFAEETLATAQGTTDEQRAYKVLREIQTSLPKPYYF